MTPCHDDGSHPDLDRWIAYRDGDLGGDDDRALQDHLVGCPSCTSLVLDLEAFADPPTPAADIGKAAIWRTLRPQLRRSATRRWAVPATLAASFLAAAFGVGLWLQQRELAELRGQAAALSRPQANAPVYDLFPRTVRRGEPARGATLAIPATAPAFTLILNRAQPGEPGTCRAEIVDSEGRPAAVVDGLVLDEAGVFTLALPRGNLAAGDYAVRLWATEGSSETPIEEYPLRIVYR